MKTANPATCTGRMGSPETHISLRDVFAGQIAAALSMPDGRELSPEYVARVAYERADALLAQRVKESQ